MRHKFLYACILALLAVHISNAQTFTDNGITYEIINANDEGAVAVISSATSAYTGSLTIPSEVNYENATYKVTKIKSLGNSPELYSVSVPASIIEVVGNAFENCIGLKELRLEDGDQKISLGYLKYVPSGFGKGTFRNCPLKNLYIGRKMTYEGGNAYGYGPFCQNPNLEKIEFGDNISYIDDYLCFDCPGLTDVVIPNGVTGIGGLAFCHTSLINLKIPSSVTEIGTRAFDEISTLKTLDIEKSLIPLTIRQGESNYLSMFIRCNLDYLFIGREIIGAKQYYPLGVYTSDNSAIEVGNGVRYIRDHSVSITSLPDRTQKLILGEDVSVIGSGNFENCGAKLTSIICKSELPPVVMDPSTMLSKVDVNNCTLYVPKHSVDLYKADAYWKKFFIVEEINNDVSALDDSAIHRIYLQPSEHINLSQYLADSRIAEWSNSNDKVIAFTPTNIEAEALSYGESTVIGFDSYGNIVVVFDVFVCPFVTIEHGIGTIYKHPVIYNSTPNLFIAVPEGHDIAGVTHDGEDITDLVIQNNGNYAVKTPLIDNSIINIAIKDDTMTQIESPALASPIIRISVDGRNLTIKGTSSDSKIKVFDLSGAECYNGVNKPIILPSGGIYFVSVQSADVISKYKIIVR